MAADKSDKGTPNTELLNKNLAALQKLVNLQNKIELEEGRIIELVNNDLYDEVVHKLYSKKDIEMFLEGIFGSLDKPISKQQFKSIFTHTANHFAEDFIDKLLDYNTETQHAINDAVEMILKANLGDDVIIDKNNYLIMKSQESYDVTKQFQEIISGVKLSSQTLIYDKPIDASEWLERHVLVDDLENGTLLLSVDY